MEPVQCRMARSALGWSASDLAEAASLSAKTVMRFENHGIAGVSAGMALQQALDAEGAKFGRTHLRVSVRFREPDWNRVSHH